MAVFEGSRYERARLTRVQAADGEYYNAVFRVPDVGRRINFRNYVVQEGERLDLIAWRTYGDPELYWMIADINPEFPDPERIPAGSVIRVPTQ